MIEFNEDGTPTTEYNDDVEDEYDDEAENSDFDEEDDVEEEIDVTYVQSLFTDDTQYNNLMSGLSSKARDLVQAYEKDESATVFADGVLNDTKFVYNQFQSAITREFRFLTMRELYAAVDASDSYGTQAEINTTSISGILSDPHIGIFKLQQLLTAPHCTERIDVRDGTLEYVGVGLRHRVVTLTLLAYMSGVDITSDSWLDQELEVQVSSSINAEGVEDTELSGALVLADNASRKAYAGEKASFKLNALGVSFDEESLTAAAFTGRIQAGEAFGTILSLWSGDLNRNPTTLLSLGKAFYAKAKKYINSKADFVSAYQWIATNYIMLDKRFTDTNDSGNVARNASKFSTEVLEAWKSANKIVEPLKATKKKATNSKSPKLFRKSL
jgi:hypothetical protein